MMAAGFGCGSSSRVQGQGPATIGGGGFQAWRRSPTWARSGGGEEVNDERLVCGAATVGWWSCARRRLRAYRAATVCHVAMTTAQRVMTD